MLPSLLVDDVLLCMEYEDGHLHSWKIILECNWEERGLIKEKDYPYCAYYACWITCNILWLSEASPEERKQWGKQGVGPPPPSSSGCAY
jgi:hypothetical protein